MKPLNLFLTGKYFLTCLTITVVSLFLLFYAPGKMRTEFDDAYMYCRYSSNFLSGNGFCWNVEDGAAYGVTSSGYLFLITFLKWILPGTGNSLLLSATSLVCIVLGLLLLVLTGNRTGQKLRVSGLPYLSVVLLIVIPALRYHAFTGMETTLSFAANALLVFSVVSCRKRPGTSSLVFVVISAFLAVQIRPDNGLYALLFPFILFLIHCKKGSRVPFLFLIPLVFTLILWQLVLSKLFGSVIPVPFYAKACGFLQGYAGLSLWNSTEYLLLFLRDSSPFIALCALTIQRKSSGVLVSILIPMILSFAFFSRTVQIMGWFYRYYFPSIPFIVFAAFHSLDKALENGFHPSTRQLLFRLSICCLLIIPAAASPLRNIISHTQANSTLTETVTSSFDEESDLPYLEWWECITGVSGMIGNLPDGVRVAASEHGYIAAENPHAHIIDMAGLHDMELAKNGFTAPRILNMHPDLIWLPHHDYILFRKLLLESEDFRNCYQFFPGVFNYGMAISVNSSMADTIRSELASVFTEEYPGFLLDDCVKTF